mgnify:CR=1 FL=1
MKFGEGTFDRRLDKALFAAGCFWGVQGVFEHVKGVTRAVSGYAGGKSDTAHYNLVSRGDTGHAESVRVTFDPRAVSYDTLLTIFFLVAHDDKSNPIEAAMLYLEYKRQNLSAELHICAKGGHGFGMRKSKDPISDWPTRCGEWMQSIGLLGAIPTANKN